MKRLLATILLLAMLTGCSSNSYLSVRPHAGPRTEVTDTITVENYTQLRNALVQQIDLHATQISLMTYAYTGDVQQDLEEAVAYIRYHYPIGAYAIRTLTYDISQVASYYQISLRVSYSHSSWELEQISQVSMDNLESLIGEAMNESVNQQIIMISAYRNTDFSAYCTDYALRNPDKVMQVPEITTRIWPENGSVRIVELNYDYTLSSYELQQMQAEVEQILDAAKVYVGYGRTAREKVDLLHSFLSERYIYMQSSTDTPAYSMLCEGIADSKIYAEVFRIVCEKAGLECYAVNGLKNGQVYKWNIVCLEGAYYHIDPFAAEVQGLGQLPLYQDDEMTNYIWDQTIYPAAVSR